MEVSPPVGYDGPINYAAFRDAAEFYYRSCIGENGSVINIKGSSNVRMRNNRFMKTVRAEFEVGLKMKIKFGEGASRLGLRAWTQWFRWGGVDSPGKSGFD